VKNPVADNPPFLRSWELATIIPAMPVIRSERPYMRASILTLLLCCHFGIAAGKDLVPDASKVQRILSIAGQDLSNGLAAQPRAFDISPDDKELAVEFWVLESPDVIARWVGVWEIATKRLITKRRLEGPLSKEEDSNPQFRYDVRFSPDGQILVVLTGERVRVLDAKSLEPLYAVEPSELLAHSRYGPVIRQFDIAEEGQRLAVLSNEVNETVGVTGGSVRIVKIVSGQQVSEWVGPSRSATLSISLSPNGETVLAGFDLLDGSSGRLIRRFREGPSGQTRFWGPDHIVALPPYGTDAQCHFLGNSISVFDIKSGEVAHELSFKPFGPSNILAVATRSDSLVILGLLVRGGFVGRFQECPVTSNELLLFRPDGTLVPLLRRIMFGPKWGGIDGLRISSDTGLLAVLGKDGAVSVLNITIHR
jgi:hypothetical protein